MKTITLFLLLTLGMLTPVFAQEAEMANSFRSEGKIYVVVLVLSIVVTGLFGYLFYLDKKVSSKENTQIK
jgi:hypothetical protein